LDSDASDDELPPIINSKKRKYQAEKVGEYIPEDHEYIAWSKRKYLGYGKAKNIHQVFDIDLLIAKTKTEIRMLTQRQLTLSASRGSITKKVSFHERGEIDALSGILICRDYPSLPWVSLAHFGLSPSWNMFSVEI
jgi:hypothetical protein